MQRQSVRHQAEDHRLGVLAKEPAQEREMSNTYVEKYTRCPVVLHGKADACHTWDLPGAASSRARGWQGPAGVGFYIRHSNVLRMYMCVCVLCIRVCPTYSVHVR